MVISLERKHWKDFCLDNLFKISSTLSGIDKCRLINLEGKFPYITRTDKNNGYELFVGNQNVNDQKDVSNVITIGLDTQTVFYQPASFYTGQNIQILQSEHINKHTALFIIPMIKILMKKFNWGGNGATLTRLKRSRILLPVNSKGEPDYEFMEEYVKEREEKLKKRYKEHVLNSICKLNKELELKNSWKDFALTDIFIPEKGNQNNMSSLTDGDLPLVSAKKVDNGYKMFATKNNKKTFPANIITLNNDGDGGAGIAYYQPAKHLLDSHVTALIPKDKNLSKNILLYLATAITNQRAKFGHGYSINSNRLKIFRFMLPVNSKGEPDYKYMEDYMKYLEQKKLLEYIEYIK